MLEEFKHHPNIIKKHEYHDYNGHAYIAFKFPKANSLFDFLSILHAVIEPVEFDNQARFLFRQFIAGLKVIHGSDKAHLDIKTQNVFAELLHEPNQEEFDQILWAPCIQIAGLGKITEVSDEFDGR